MQGKDINEMVDAEHSAWLAQVGGVVDVSAPTEENLIALISCVLRETDKTTKAKMLTEVANMSLAMADVTLGAQDYVAKCIVFNKH